jgi:hypothetical protein
VTERRGRERRPSAQAAQAAKQLEACEADMVRATQRILETAREIVAAIPEEIVPDWDDTSVVRNIEEMRDNLATEPRDVTSTWKPVQIRAGLRVVGPTGNNWSGTASSDGKGNLALRAHDGAEMSIQRKDVANLIRVMRVAAGDLTLTALDGTELGIRAVDRPALIDRLEQEAARFSTGRPFPLLHPEHSEAPKK